MPNVGANKACRRKEMPNVGTNNALRRKEMPNVGANNAYRRKELPDVRTAYAHQWKEMPIVWTDKTHRRKELQNVDLTKYSQKEIPLTEKYYGLPALSRVWKGRQSILWHTLSLFPLYLFIQKIYKTRNKYNKNLSLKNILINI